MPKLTKAKPVPKLSIVNNISGYDPVCLFARGGMAQVFLARSKSKSVRLVAIKSLRVSYIGVPEQVTLFADEMRLTHLLRHPNIVELVEAGVIEGEPFLVLEYIDGPSLRELSYHHHTLDQVMDVRLAASLIYWACQGLHYAHGLVDEWGTQLDIVHRDLNPHNLMVTRSGVVKVLDFGVARAVGQVHQTIGHGIKGKIAYAAPEYVKGAIPDQRADIFGLGVVLWELLTNRRLFFRATAVGTMQAVVDDEAPLPSKINDSVMPEIDELTLWALEKDPDDRLGSSSGFAGGLEDAVAGLGGIMMPDEISECLAISYGELLEERLELNPTMSNEQLSRSAGGSRMPEPYVARPREGAMDSWPSVEFSIEGEGGFRELDESFSWVDVEGAWDESEDEP